MSNIYKIEKLDHFGRGIIKINDKIGFVNNALLGDEVTIRIIEEKKNFFICEVQEYIRKSNLRKNSFCKYSPICGGCDICELDYKIQLKYKEEKVRNIFNKYLKDSNIKVNPIISSNDLYYRNKITLHVKNGKLGLFRKNSNELISVDSCLLVNPKINEIIPKISEFIRDKSVSSVIIKCTNLDEVMLVFNGILNKNEVLNTFSCESIFINNNCIKNKYIYETLSDYKFALSKDSFFQVNRFNTINLYNEVVRFIKNKTFNNVLDLYCGTGTIGIFISKYVKKVTGIEVVSDAINSANINKRINNINNIDFICGKVEDNIDKFKDIDLIIADPPRNGMDKKTLDSILKINPKNIVYVSCDIMTLVRDLNILKKDYNVLEITPVDMFPNTYHVETVCLLCRKN